jgi:PAS domain S-box-containing protein
VSAAPRPVHEAERLASLQQYGILDTLPEVAFDELTRLTAQLCAAPIAVISFVDAERQWFKSRVGVEVAETPRDQGLCAWTILQSGLFVIEDAAQDERFRANPLVTAPPHIRFYAGVPLVGREGYNIGVLCVLDWQPRRLVPEQAEALAILARQVMTQLELRRNLVELARNVEEHKQIEQQLRNSEAFYHSLVEMLPQHILRKDRQGRFTFVNRRFCELLGRPLDQILGRTDRDFFPRELADKYHRDDLRVMFTRQALDAIEAHVTPRGERRYVHVIKTPLCDSQDQVVGIQGIFWDVTERKRVEEDLAYERELLRALLNNTPDRIFFKDTESRFIRCSASLVKRLGLRDPKQVEGKTDFDFYPRELAQEYYADEQQIILTQQPLISKLERRVTPDGQETWASVTKVPVYSQSGTIAGIIGLARDVTALKQAEGALKHARDAALESARIKSQFLANISHEIRTPMHAITGMTGLLVSTPLSPEQRDYAETIRHSTDTLLGIINDILDYSKIEAGKLSLEHIDFDLREAVESTVGMLAERAHQKGLELACWVEHTLPQGVRGDPGRFRQILINLVTNAIKFTARGEVLVRVSLQRETPDGVEVHVWVNDTGVGISEEALSRIFNAFTQADGSTTRKFGGTGLGLAISRELVEMMHGQLGVESVVGQGSRFWLRVPFERSAAPGPRGHDASPAILNGRRVLVVDDSATLQGILHDQFQHWHMIDASAQTAEEALRHLRDAAASGHPFDLAVVDLTLSDTDGLTLARQIRDDPVGQATRLVLLTPLGQRPAASALRAAGIAACLFKPLRQARLSAALVEILESRSETTDPFPRIESPAVAPGLPEVCDTPAADLRILLAEDNVVNQRITLKQLQRLGYQAAAVSNGAEVLEAVKRGRYDVILMDCQMPELDGYEVTRRLRQAEKASNAPEQPAYIIALTAHAFQGDREKCLAAGMDDYLTKPLQLPRLKQALQRVKQTAEAIPAPGDAEITTSESSPSALDTAALAALRELREPGQSDPLKELGELFLKDARARLQQIESALAGREAPRLAAAAHALKGSASNIGARRLSALCLGLEQLAKAGDLTEAASILLNLRSEFHCVEESLVIEMQK